jgi:hypothetical protein
LTIMAMSAVEASTSNFRHGILADLPQGRPGSQKALTVTDGAMKCTGAELTSGELDGLGLGSIAAHLINNECLAFGQAATFNTTACICCLYCNFHNHGRCRNRV